MITVGVSGAAGSMGRLVCDAVDASDDLTLEWRYDPSGRDGASADRDALARVDVVVEFTNPDVVMDNLAAWRAMGSHAIVGTSGFDQTRIAEVEEMWRDAVGRCFVVPNFSIGAVLMMRFAEMAAPHFAAAEVIELHHDRKLDAPSGTALATAARMAANPQERQVESTEQVEGSRGGDADGVRIHSVRLPGLVAHQEVLLGSAGEFLTIRHDTTDRVSFMPGVLRAIRRVGELTDPVTVGLDAVLD